VAPPKKIERPLKSILIKHAVTAEGVDGPNISWEKTKSDSPPLGIREREAAYTGKRKRGTCERSEKKNRKKPVSNQ